MDALRLSRTPPDSLLITHTSLKVLLRKQFEKSRPLLARHGTRLRGTRGHAPAAPCARHVAQGMTASPFACRACVCEGYMPMPNKVAADAWLGQRHAKQHDGGQALCSGQDLHGLRQVQPLCVHELRQPIGRYANEGV